MKLVIMGAPGAGKGTQAEIISKKLGIPTISTGEILRNEVKNETPIGIKVKLFMEVGELVPDEVVIGIIKERIKKPDCKNGYILDGMPRTIAQAEALESADIDIDAVLSIEIDDKIIVERMSGRLFCPECGATFHKVSAPPKKEGICDVCGKKLERRKDDDPEKVMRRLDIYHSDTEPLKRYYKDRDIYMQVKNREGIEATTKVVFEALGI